MYKISQIGIYVTVDEMPMSLNVGREAVEARKVADHRDGVNELRRGSVKK